MAKTYTREEFVKEYSPFISSTVKGTGILSGTLISQAILESSGRDTDGNWKVGASTLSKNANNWFGIKADKGWHGDTYKISTAEYDKSGRKYYIVSPFRKYNSVQDSIKDYVNFLQQNSRYRDAGVFNAKTVSEQASLLRKAGYATSPNYASTVSNIYDSIKSFVSQGYEETVKYTKKNWIPITIVFVGVVGLGYYLYKSKKFEQIGKLV